MFWFYGHKACGILAVPPGIKLTLYNPLWLSFSSTDDLDLDGDL